MASPLEHTAGDGTILHETPRPESSSQTVRPHSACNRCRLRKVKCDRVQPACNACVRLQQDCSYTRRSTSPNSEIIQPSTYTEAGLKRKRTRLACGNCRVTKAKCSGTSPCDRCRSRSLACDLGTSIAHPSVNEGTISIQTPRTVSSTATTMSSWPLDRAATRSFIDAYFHAASATIPVFLHKPTVLADWNNETINQSLLECIVAVGLFTNDTRPEGRAMARTWLQKVQDDIYKRIGQQSVSHLMTLIILLRFRFQVGDSADAWGLLAVAARSAFTMRLNYERDGLEPLVQESHRRLVWVIYLLDRLFSGGIEDLKVCPLERIHIRLPCDERSFEMGIPSKAGFIGDTSQELGAYMHPHAFKLALLATRDRILRYTKDMRRNGKSPVEGRPEMKTLQAELDMFEQGLPPELKLTSQRLAVLGHSREAGAYAGLHSLWMMCHCDLYRFCVPGIRESVSKDALAITPPEFIEYCQQQCLSKAIQLCDLWSHLYHLESSECLGDEFLAVSIYQVAQILHHLPRLLPESGEHSIASLKKKLSEALKLAAPLAQIYCNTGKCLSDSERLINALGRDSVLQSSPDHSTVEGIEAADQHLASRYSILPHLYRNQEPSENMSHRTGGGDRSDGVLRNAEVMAPSYPSTEYNLLDRERRVEQGGEQGLSEMFFWDPFNMQLNGYYDPDLDFPFV
ncbi:hypothetical protein BJY01DRAFT_218807 [Aspergillus pseudoustus]|uniref:Zn(2)-C6 fungal-type domain-containing protein n=1 Tax=Aspergillus pseudoustus TaxID=1810923 RepID=A0ABR4JIR8_9EURO